MIKFIIKRFIKDSENVKDRYIRESYTVLSGILGIICNFILFALKLSIGVHANSIAIISDAFNNISDLGSSVVAILGSKLSNRPPDKEHPHGHGRYEYIASLVVSFIIFGVGLETLRSSIDKIINPESVEFNSTIAIILAFSILVKIWMFSYNRYIDKKIDSSVNRATAIDSFNDSIATFGVIIGSIIGQFTTLPIDGILGLIISIIIIYSGFSIARDSVRLLLGASPDPKLIEKIKELILENDNVKGVHDLVIHDYGPNKIMASIHAEVSREANIVNIHSEIDDIERKVGKELNIDMVIHMDPIEDDEMQ